MAAVALILALVCLSAGCATTGTTSNIGASSSPPAQTKPASPIQQTPEKTQQVSLQEAITQAARKIAGDLPPGSKVAIIAFESEHDNISAYLIEEFTDSLMNHNLIVADRSNLAQVRRELNFQMSGDVDDQSALSIGKFLGAQLVISGQFINLGDSYRFRIHAVNVETSVRDSSSQFALRNDQSLQNLIAALSKNKTATKSLEY